MASKLTAGDLQIITRIAVFEVAGEKKYRLPPLPVPDPSEPATVDALTQSAAVRLFVDRVFTRPIAGQTLASFKAIAEAVAATGAASPR